MSELCGKLIGVETFTYIDPDMDLLLMESLQYLQRHYKVRNFHQVGKSSQGQRWSQNIQAKSLERIFYDFT